MARTPHGMAKAGGLLLADIHHRSRIVQHGFDNIQRLVLAFRGQRRLKFEGMVEMILNGGLVAAGDEDEFLDASLGSLLHRILDKRFVDDRQHFLRHGLGGRKEAGAKSADRKNGCLDHGGVLAIFNGGWYPWIALPR